MGTNSSGRKIQKKKSKIRICYSFLTITLLFCIIYFSYSAFLNISKCLNMPAKHAQMNKLNKAAIAQNKKLKEEISNFESIHSLEAIARNNLKMAGKDEILVIFNDAEIQ